MPIVDDIRKPIEPWLEEYKAFLARYMRSDSEHIEAILNYILENGGKNIRPTALLLSASMHSPNPEHGPGMRAYLGAMLVEMMHTASLVHDDVIDESDMRRGKPSVRAMLDSRRAVIVGDFILARSIRAGLESAQFDIVSYVVRAMSELCEGELIQSAQSRKLEMTREIYLDIIRKKTATLFGVCAGAGAMSVGATPEQVEAMRNFGEGVGMAFQIRDDIMDYDTRADTGKPALNDLGERKITLPLLAVLERSTPERRAELLARLASVAERPENIEYLHDVVITEGGIAEAESVMKAYIAGAHSILADYPPSPYRDALTQLASYAGERKK